MSLNSLSQVVENPGGNFPGSLIYWNSLTFTILYLAMMVVEMVDPTPSPTPTPPPRPSRKGMTYIKPKASLFGKNAMQSMFNATGTEMLKLQVGNHGRLPHGSMNKLLGDLKGNSLLSHITRDHLNNHLERVKKGMANDATTVSENTTPSSTTTTTINNDTDKQNKGGRPPGATKAAQQSQKKGHEEAMERAANVYFGKQQEARNNNKLVMNGVLKSVVVEANTKFNLTVTMFLMRNQCKRE